MALMLSTTGCARPHISPLSPPPYRAEVAAAYDRTWTALVRAIAKQNLPLRAIARRSLSSAPLAVNHQGQFPSVTISFNLAEGASLGQAMDDVRQAELSIGLPPTVQSLYSGTAQAGSAAIAAQPAGGASSITVHGRQQGLAGSLWQADVACGRGALGSVISQAGPASLIEQSSSSVSITMPSRVDALVRPCTSPPGRESSWTLTRKPRRSNWGVELARSMPSVVTRIVNARSEPTPPSTSPRRRSLGHSLEKAPTRAVIRTPRLRRRGRGAR